MTSPDHRIDLAKAEVLRRVTRSAFHEFNQSLTTLSFTASFLAITSKTAANTDITRAADDIAETQDRLASLLRVLDWLTREEAELRKIELAPFLGECAKLLGTRLRKHHCQLNLQVSDDLAALYTYPEHLVQFFFAAIFLLIDGLPKTETRKKMLSLSVDLQASFGEYQLSIDCKSSSLEATGSGSFSELLTGFLGRSLYIQLKKMAHRFNYHFRSRL
jgi:C4-dicarboxylate-specific signal transduction histidine kinase